MRRSLSLLAVTLGVWSASAAPLPVRPGPGLALELTCSNWVVTPDVDPRFAVFLVNRGKKTVTVVLPGDGSEDGWRTPVVRWEQDRGIRMRPGSVKPLTPADVIELAPGQRVKLNWVGRPALDTGLNRVSVELEHNPTLKWRGIPGGREHDAATMKKVQAIPAIKLTSNIVEVVVQER
jgi:hypothetical protein